MGEYTPRIKLALPDDGEIADYDGETGPQDIEPIQTGPNPEVNWIDSHQSVGFFLDETYIDRGTFANRPAAGSTSPVYYVVTDGANGPYLSYNDGTAWNTIASGGGGGGGTGGADPTLNVDVTGQWDFYDTIRLISQAEPYEHARFQASTGDAVVVRTAADGTISFIPHDSATNSLLFGASWTWDPSLKTWELSQTDVDGVAQQTQDEVDAAEARITQNESDIGALQTLVSSGQELYQQSAVPTSPTGGDWWLDTGSDPAPLTYYDAATASWKAIAGGGTSGGGTTYPVMIASFEEATITDTDAKWGDITSPANWALYADATDGTQSIGTDTIDSRDRISLPGDGLPSYFGQGETIAIDMKMTTLNGVVELRWGYGSYGPPYYRVLMDAGRDHFKIWRDTSTDTINVVADTGPISYTANSWYTVEVEYHPGTTNDVNAWLIDSTGSLVSGISGTDGLPTGSGVGLRSNSTHGRWDNIRKIQSPTFG